jgi:hypothetical protein
MLLSENMRQDRASVLPGEVCRRLARARSVCVLTGLLGTHRVGELASPQAFARDPRFVSTWYDERLAAPAIVE